MPDLNLDMTFPANKKTRQLVRLLGKRAEAIPIRVWCYVGTNHPDTGDLVGYSRGELRAIVGEGPVKKVFDALLASGFLEEIPGGFHVHDWEDRAGHLRVYRERAREAAKERWRKHHASSNASSTGRSIAPSYAPVPSGPDRSSPVPPSTEVFSGRDPFGPAAPPEVRSAAEKRRAGDAWFESGGTSEKPPPWLTALAYGPDSRNDERERLLLWESGDDEAFRRHVVPAFEMGPTP